MRPRQLPFLPKAPKEYGGSTRKGKRKIQRPFDPKRPLHLSLRASEARAGRSLLHQNLKWKVWSHLERISRSRRVRIYRYANVGNHLHLLVQARTRRDFQAFLREFAGAVAVTATGAAKGRPQKFWDGLAWSEVVGWGRHYKNVVRYIMLNVLEASGLRNRELLARLESEGIIYFAPDPGS